MKKNRVRKKFSPDVSRHFILLFDIMDYLPKIDEALHYFFERVISTHDTLVVVTPMKSYSFNKEILATLSQEKIAERLIEIIRRDTILGNNKYKSLIRDYESIYRADYETKTKLFMLMDKIRELKNLRYVGEDKVLYFADYLKSITGQKFAFFFYQKELLPIPDIPVESREYMDMQSELAYFASFDTKNITRAYSDSSISLHFLYVTKTQMVQGDVENMGQTEMNMQEMSLDIFNTFHEIARATGGLSESSTNVASLLKNAADASENYYLLYYTPRVYIGDGKFKKIEVKVKNKNYRITHRAGYIAN
ncbi:MAG: hypothetical protein JSV46_09405 [Candidatus Aminicenantes bacterium]|nr:MAG: hypothetical protein JSV46_09405 [Candidatus Aminicenantes bacterium]